MLTSSIGRLNLSVGLDDIFSKTSKPSTNIPKTVYSPSKGGKPPQEWMPLNKSYHCKYIEKWKHIKNTYALEESVAEKTFINNEALRNRCSD